MTYDQWARARKQSEERAMLDTEVGCKEYFAAVVLLNTLATALARKEAV